jgi:tetratricopeptide (TPR) repeat protein
MLLFEQLEKAKEQLNGFNFNKALEILQKILSVDPNYVDALKLLGSLYIEMGEDEEAASCLQKAIKIQPDVETIMTLSQIQPVQDCIQSIRSALTLMKEPSQDSSAALRSRVLCALAESLYVQKHDGDFKNPDFKEISDILKEAERNDDQNPEIYQIEAKILISQGLENEAKDQLTKCIGIYNNIDFDTDFNSLPSFGVRLDLIRTLLSVQMLKECVPILESLLAEDEEELEAWYLGALIFWNLLHEELKLSNTEFENFLESIRTGNISNDMALEYLNNSHECITECMKVVDKYEAHNPVMADEISTLYDKFENLNIFGNK